MSNISFDILVDSSLSSVASNECLKKILNKKLLSLINDFEDGKWRSRKFHEYIWNNIVETALSAKEKIALSDKAASALRAAAYNLRLTDNDKIGNGSEIAEIFLYGVMKDHYKALPVVPKIFYKQNSNDNVKGADSVHIVVNENKDDFTLWFGEAKLYNSLKDVRLNEIVTSVYTTLNTEKINKENSIITNVNDIDLLVELGPLRTKIKDALNTEKSIDFLKPKINIPILIIHECKNTKACTELSDDYLQEIKSYHLERAEAYFLKQLKKSSTVQKYSDITFHLILFPIPDKNSIVDSFTRTASFYRSND